MSKPDPTLKPEPPQQTLELFPLEPIEEGERVWVHGYTRMRGGKPIHVDGHWRLKKG